MTDIRMIVLGIVVLVAGFFGFSTLYTVSERDQALVLEFGKVADNVSEPGLHVKWNWPIQNVVYFDKRVLDFDARAEEIPTMDQKQIVVDAFARYRIVNPLLFFQTVTNEQGMASRLDKIINANLRAVFGEVELAVFLTPKRSELMSNIAARVKNEGKAYGVEVLDVRMRRVDLPEENSQAIYRQMQSQREQEARLIRAEGGKEARKIRAEADKTAQIIVANAERKANIMRGEGDAKAQELYNNAYGQDRDFFDFYVSMNSMLEGLPGQSTRYVGPPGGDFFRYFGDISGKGGTKGKAK